MNGDLTSSTPAFAGAGSRTVTWSAFGMPVRLARGLRSIDLVYGPDRARFKRIDTNETGLTTTHYIAGGAMEAVTSATGSVTRRVYVAGAAIVIDVETLPGVVTPAETRYLLKDHLGSLDVVTDSNGLVLERLSFDAWGQRRKVDWTQYANNTSGGGLPGDSYPWQGQQITRGYTGHEQLDPVGLVHMNGRVYDAEIGRFLSADIVIQDVTNLQSLNAYSYVLNNPLSFTDPTGFFFKSLFRAIGNVIRSVFRAIRAAFKAVLRSSIGRAIIQIVACANPAAIYTCAATAGALALQAGGSMKDAIVAAAFAFAQMEIWSGVGEFVRQAGLAADAIGKGFVHGVVGGALAVSQGGSFVQGFAANAIGGAAGVLSGGIGGENGLFLRTAIASTAGGLGSQLTGGKFANGAITAAFAHLYNFEGGGRTFAGAVARAVGYFLPPPVRAFIFVMTAMASGPVVEPLSNQGPNTRTQGYAVIWNDGTAHMSIQVIVDDEMIHTELLGVRGEMTEVAIATNVGQVYAGPIPLPNAHGALEYSRSMVGQGYGMYDPKVNSCYTYCSDVLRAGGLDIGRRSGDFGRFIERYK